MIVRHYKGGLYNVVIEETHDVVQTEMLHGSCGRILATHTEDASIVHVFIYLDGTAYTRNGSFVVYEDGHTHWARPAHMFWELGYFNRPDILESRFTIVK